MDRKLATIQKITDLTPIAGADAILCAKVLGWECVVKKEEFKVGDLCVYFEIDSILPVEDWNAHLRKGSDSHKPLRVRTIRLRGQLSQGLALPIHILRTSFAEYLIGDDVTEVIGVQKYEPYIPAELSGKVKGTRPSWIPKTDEPRLQSDPEALGELLALDVDVVGTMKMDGTSITCFIKDNVFGVTSRNMELIETEDNAFWKTVREAKVEEKMRDHLTAGGNYAIQGELSGMGIQGNRMGLPELNIFWFNLFNIDTAKYLSAKELFEFCQVSQLTHVPIHFMGKLPTNTTLIDLLKMSNELTYSNGLPAEGIVWRPIHETHSDILKGRMSFKVISNIFIEKYKE